MSNPISATLKSWSQSLFSKWRRQPPPRREFPGNLSLEQAANLVQLQQHPGWTHFLSALRQISVTTAHEILSGRSSYEDYRFLTGKIAAFDQIAMLPETLSLAIRERKKVDERRTTGPERTEDRLAYGNPYYRGHRYGGDPASPAERSEGLGEG